MRSIVRVGACQTPEIISDPATALAIMLQFAKEAEDKNVDLLLYPECFLTGYIHSSLEYISVRDTDNKASMQTIETVFNNSKEIIF